MGWVEDRFRDHLTSTRQIRPFWNELRDSVGRATVDYNQRIGDADHLDHTDCMARGPLCTRLHKAGNGATLELFLDEEHRQLKAAPSVGGEIRTVCGYRLNADRTGLEFFRADVRAPDGTIALTVEEACELAIEEFLFNPFPARFRTDL